MPSLQDHSGARNRSLTPPFTSHHYEGGLPGMRHPAADPGDPQGAHNSGLLSTLSLGLEQAGPTAAPALTLLPAQGFPKDAGLGLP